MASLSFCTPACFFGARMTDALFSASPSHLYFHPHPALKKYIAHYTLSPPCVSGPAHLTLIPDASGCLVFAFGPSGIQAHFWGPTTHTVEVYNDFKQTPYRFFCRVFARRSTSASRLICQGCRRSSYSACRCRRRPVFCLFSLIFQKQLHAYPIGGD